MSSAAWMREQGWLLSHDGSGPAQPTQPTHLLLDGGKARVPDESAGAFLSAYAIAVVRRVPLCVVELRTPVFRLFLDLDVKTPAESPLDFDAVMRVLQRCVAEVFEVDTPPRAVVCVTEARELDDGAIKQGRHVVWTNVWASTATALAFRLACVAALEAALPGACCKPWATVVDACVFTSNGLRMPWSAKGRGGSAVYVPSRVWVSEAVEQEVGEPSGVSEVRRWARELSIRAFGVDETAVREGVEVPRDAAPEGLCGTTRSLREYGAVLPALDEVLPVQYAGQKFTGVIKADNCFLLRSSSRYCANLGRAHNSCGIYWILTLKGIRQGCYCRCDTDQGRKYGQCRDFKGEIYRVPDEVLMAFFGVAAPKPDDFKLPSAKAAGADSLADLLARSRPALASGGKRRRKR